MAYPDRGDPQDADGDRGAGRAGPVKRSRPAADTTAGTVARAVTCTGSPISRVRGGGPQAVRGRG
ncbi:hypothetical protein, partial [Micromonospora sp. ATA51]|uniref:hypothetical protein n=1 Tax=Micromonospora sp. ATA51 TaxID=2806098 RepID=UPI001EE4728D